MSNAAIKKIRLKILEIPEVSSTLGSDVVSAPVLVTLKKGELADSNIPFYQGIMRWKDEATCKKHKIDIVQAVFSNEGQTGDTGLVELEVKLKGGLKFNDEPVSKVPKLDPTIDERTLRCIRYEVDEVNPSVITITFLEPNEGEVVTYPVIYFLTNKVDKEGKKENFIIDPGLGAIRIPP
jgi:hypothetical protein